MESGAEYLERVLQLSLAEATIITRILDENGNLFGMIASLFVCRNGGLCDIFSGFLFFSLVTSLSENKTNVYLLVVYFYQRAGASEPNFNLKSVVFLTKARCVKNLFFSYDF